MKMSKTNLAGFLTVLLFAGAAFAAGTGAGDNEAALAAMADKATKIFDGSLLKIAINSAGLAAIVYSIIGGFKATPFIGGILLVVFHAMFSAYTKSFF